MDIQQRITSINHLYQLGATRASVLRDGPDNTVGLLETESGKKYVVRVSKRPMEDEVAFEARWLRFLHRARVPVVPMVETTAGKSYALLPSGAAVTIFAFVSGNHLAVDPNTPPPRAAIISLAAALAQLHNASRGHLISLPRRRTIFSELERALKHARKIEEKLPDGKAFIGAVRKFFFWGKTYSFVPVLVHNDYRMDNLLFDGHNNVRAILDFDWCCGGPAIKDVAHALAEWSFPDGAKEHWEDVFSVFLTRYNEVTEETVARDGNLCRWIAFSCLSDTCAYLVDHLLRDEIRPVGGSYMYQKFKYFNARAR